MYNNNLAEQWEMMGNLQKFYGGGLCFRQKWVFYKTPKKPRKPSVYGAFLFFSAAVAGWTSDHLAIVGSHNAVA